MKPKEIVVVSGKGGTGKTSLMASLAVLASEPVLADCDVDAADLHLLLNPQIQTRQEFWSGKKASIRQADCFSCGHCRRLCRFEAVHTEASSVQAPLKYLIDPIGCEGCGVCVHFCPVQAIDFKDSRAGEWFVSATRQGPMVHARLKAGAENSGKLVAVVREQARRLAAEHNRELILIDGPPGIGCAVIAAITGASVVVAVTEPTLSARHDLERLLALARHFSIPVLVWINKWDLDPQMTADLELHCRELGVELLGRVRYDPIFVAAQIQGKTLVELDSGEVAEEIRSGWKRLQQWLA